MHWPGTWEEWSQFAQFGALAGAAVFLLLKAFLGYFMINLSVEPIVQRSRGRDRDTDALLLTLKLTKGDREGASIERIVIRPSRIDGCKVIEEYQSQEHELANPILGRRFKMSPGETAFFSYHLEIPADATCMIKVEVFGGSGFFGRPTAYWMAQSISLPPQEAS